MIIHEHFLEGSLRRQGKLSQQVCLSALVDLIHVIENAHSLLLFERQCLLDSFGHSKASEDALLSSFVQIFIVVSVGRIRLLR